MTRGEVVDKMLIWGREVSRKNPPQNQTLVFLEFGFGGRG